MMKKLLIVCSLCAIAVMMGLAKCNAQALVDWGFGFDAATGKPIMDLSAGYQQGHLKIEGEMIPSLTRAVGVNNLFGIKAGYEIAGCLTPSAGYYYDLKDGDNKSLNKYYPGFSLKYIKQINDRGGLYLAAMYFNDDVQVTTGVHIVF